MDMLDVAITNPDHPGNPPTSTVSDFSVPAIQHIDLTAPGGDMLPGLVPLPVVAAHVDGGQSYDECAPIDNLSATGQQPWAVAQAHINTHVEDPNAPQFYMPPEVEPDFPGNADTDIAGPIVGETSEPAGQLHNALGYGPDGDNDDDDGAMPPYGEAFSTPGLAHRERHLDPMFQGLRGQVPVYDGNLEIGKPPMKATYDGAL